MQDTLRLKLAQDQAECVGFEGPQLLISGPPGTGKTIILMQRAKWLAERHTPPGGIVLFITYNRNLSRYVQEQLRLNRVEKRVNVSTYHHWAQDILSPDQNNRNRIKAPDGSMLKPIYDADQRTVLKLALQQYLASLAKGKHVLKRNLDWWESEIDWIKGRAIATWEEYRKAERIGRGTGLEEGPRRMVWEALELYNQQLRKRGECDFRDYSLFLPYFLGDPVGEGFRVDHLLVDEAQDLHPADLQILRQLARKSTTIVADRNQKIFQSGFTWSDIGFDFAGGRRSRILSCIYRPTRPIAQLAASLPLGDSSSGPDGVYFVEPSLPVRGGPKPVVYQPHDRAHESSLVISLLTQLVASAPGGTTGLLAPNRRLLDSMANLLQQRHIPFVRIADGEGSITTPGIKLLTLHSTKGLEFNHVVLLGLTEGIFPRLLAIARTGDSDFDADNDEAVKTARRLLYVAMTRAKDRLFLFTGSRPSRFIAELNDALYDTTAPEVETALPEALPMP